GAAVGEVVHEAGRLAVGLGHRAPHRLAVVEQALPGHRRGGGVDVDLVESLVAAPELQPGQVVRRRGKANGRASIISHAASGYLKAIPASLTIFDQRARSSPMTPANACGLSPIGSAPSVWRRERSCSEPRIFTSSPLSRRITA